MRPGEARETVKFSGDVADADALKEFITAEKMPLTIEFNQGNSEKIFNSGIPKQLILWAGTDELKAGSKVGLSTTPSCTVRQPRSTWLLRGPLPFGDRMAGMSGP